MTLRPNTELVAIHWLKAIEELPVDKIATVLPRDTSAWETTGFVLVGGGVGGSPDIYTTMRHPVVQLDFYAVRPGSARPPYNRVSGLAESVISFCLSTASSRVVDLPGEYGSVRVLAAYPISEPRRVPADVADYARYTMEIQLHWTPVDALIPSASGEQVITEAPVAPFTAGVQVGVPTGTSLTATTGLPAADATEQVTLTQPVSGETNTLTASVWRHRKWTTTLAINPPAVGTHYMLDECEIHVQSDNFGIDLNDTNGTLDQMQPLLILRRCTIHGNDNLGKALLAGFVWIIDCDLYGAEDAWAGGYYSVATGSNLIASTDGLFDPHQDGVQISALGSMTLYNCWISAGTDPGANSAVRAGTEFSAVAGIDVYYCGLDDGGYTMQMRGDSGAGDITNVRVVGCRWTGSAPNGNAAFGPTDFEETTVALWSDNRFIGDDSEVANPVP